MLETKGAIIWGSRMGVVLKWKRRPVLILACLVIGFLLLFSSLSGGGSKPEESVRINMKQLFIRSIALCKSAGQVVKKIYETKKFDVASKGLSKEGKQNLLTTADLDSHKLLIHGYRSVFPTLQVVSEERNSETPLKDAAGNAAANSKDEEDQLDNQILHLDEALLLQQTYFLSEREQAHKAEQRAGAVAPGAADFDAAESPLEFASFADETELEEDVTVWIDPLDATQEYTEGLHEYVTVMACVAVRGRPVMGVVYSPFSDAVYFGWTGHAVSGNLQQTVELIRAQNSSTKMNRFIVSRSHAGVVEKVLKGLIDGVHVDRAGGSGYKTVRVLLGTHDAYAHVTEIHKWDLCAPNALVDAVGGRFSSLRSDLITYKAPVRDEEENVFDGLMVTTRFDERQHNLVAARIFAAREQSA